MYGSFCFLVVMTSCFVQGLHLLCCQLFHMSRLPRAEDIRPGGCRVLIVSHPMVSELRPLPFETFLLDSRQSMLLSWHVFMNKRYIAVCFNNNNNNNNLLVKIPTRGL